MLAPVAQRALDELVPVPRSAVRFPLEMRLPPGFVADQPDTWPLVDGQLEFVEGKLVYMPPSADRQQDTSVDVVTVLGTWRRSHREFIVAGNEAGMILGGETRAADVAIWRRDAVGEYQGKYRRVAPVLAVEVQGEIEDEPMLRARARWYLARGVRVVWVVLPAERRVLVIDAAGERALQAGDHVPEHPELPGLSPAVSELFEQVVGG
jgi:Uma2 family endonuclease